MARKTSTPRLILSVFLALVLDAYAVDIATEALDSSVWLLAFLRTCLTLLAVYAINLGELPPGPARFLAVHTTLPAVLQSLGAEHLSGMAVGGARLWATSATASLLAALFWEFGVPGSNSRKDEQEKRLVLLARVLRMYWPDCFVLLGGFFFLTLAAVCQIQIQFYTGKVIDNLRDNYVPAEFSSALFFMALFSAGSAVGTGGRGGLLMWAIGSFQCRVKGDLFQAQTQQEMAFFDTKNTGELTSSLSKDIPLMAQAVCLNINVLLRTLMVTLYTVALMSELSWTLTFLVLLEVPVTALIQTFNDEHHQRLATATNDSVTASNRAAGEVIFAVRTARRFHAEKLEVGRYEKCLLETHRLKKRQRLVWVAALLARRLTGMVVRVLMLWYGRHIIHKGQMSVGQLVSFILYQSQMGQNIRMLITISGNMLTSVGAAAKVLEVLDGRAQMGAGGEAAPEPLAGHVLFRDLDFAYPTRPDAAVLRKFSLELPAGQLTALIGVSGEGKSTCASLLKGLYRAQGGQILLDHVPLEWYDRRYLSDKIAVVSQEPVLFSGSLRYNIAYGMKDCTPEAVEEAARRADAGDFIARLENGYDTEVGEGGAALSKSERQRVALARALVRKPRVLVLDEVTSSLDRHSETEVLRNLSAGGDRTVLLITHKLELVEKAQQIALMAGGAVGEKGSHRQLLEKNALYCDMRKRFATTGS
ncbi:antigen peptide transporter 2a isoform X2 [Stigmatopora nigra]